MSKFLATGETEPAKKSTSSLIVDDNRSSHRYFLGIDGGGTKTHAVIADSSHRVIGEGISGAANPLRVGLEEAIEHINQAVSEACAQAGIDREDIAFGCAAIAGINHPIHYHTMKDALDDALRVAGLDLVTDARAALEGALDGKPGVVVIAGTGSIAIGINELGQQARSGGFGPTLSDEGSGYDIARHALKAVVSSFDGRSPQTTLVNRICERLGVASPSDLPGVIYNSDSEPVDIAWPFIAQGRTKTSGARLLAQFVDAYRDWTCSRDDHESDVRSPQFEIFRPALYSQVGQLLAYWRAAARELNPNAPRHLERTVLLDVWTKG